MFNALQGNTWSSLAKLRSCIGDVDGDADNALMEAEMKRQRGNTETGEVSTRSSTLLFPYERTDARRWEAGCCPITLPGQATWLLAWSKNHLLHSGNACIWLVRSEDPLA